MIVILVTFKNHFLFYFYIFILIYVLWYILFSYVLYLYAINVTNFKVWPNKFWHMFTIVSPWQDSWYKPCSNHLKSSLVYLCGKSILLLSGSYHQLSITMILLCLEIYTKWTYNIYILLYLVSLTQHNSFEVYSCCVYQ